MYSVFRDLAIIILSAKFFALVARKCRSWAKSLPA